MSDPITEQIHEMGRKARAAAHKLSLLTTAEKDTILRAMAQGLRDASAEILSENTKDIAAGETKGLSSAMLDRLRLDEARLEAVAAALEHVATLPDPVGQVLDDWVPESGIRIEQVRVPIGTIGIIYESRPNVTADAAGLCFKTGNATILRGGSEAIHSNRAIATAIQAGGEKAGLPANSVQLVPFTDRQSVAAMAGMDQWLDLIIPRGGKGLIETVVSLARMPVIKHYDGICHLYAAEKADQEMAVKLTVDSKTQKPGVCNALETLLIDETIATEFLPKVAIALREKEVELRGCEKSCAILSDLIPATEEDWGTEYLEKILSIKIVSSIDETIAHINTHGSHHTDCIVTTDDAQAEVFLHSIDSACVMHNCSTRFADGGEFGFGAEIGISTDKLHARGPMGLRELTSYQYRVRGVGQTKA
ncbi:MAG: glutamate-5-semialdehyde dehydrogenase [Luteolibacter sp.]